MMRTFERRLTGRQPKVFVFLGVSLSFTEFLASLDVSSGAVRIPPMCKGLFLNQFGIDMLIGSEGTLSLPEASTLVTWYV